MNRLFKYLQESIMNRLFKYVHSNQTAVLSLAVTALFSSSFYFMFDAFNHLA
jgi:hypothetical protein